jgi:TPR repeat protein
MADSFEIKSDADWKDLLSKAEQGNGDAMNEVAFFYENGFAIGNIVLVEPNLQLAFNWTKKSFEIGNLDGIVRYADYLSDGDYTYCEKNIELAMELYKVAMNAGSLDAAHRLGIEYRNKQNFNKAFEMYLKANIPAELYPDLSIGLCYYHGIGIPKDKTKALEIFKSLKPDSSTQYEIDEANYLIGKIYLEGEIVEKSIETARHYLELADKDGDHRSAQELLLIIGRKAMLN